MSDLRDGSRVTYLGDGRTGRTIGEHGKVLYITGSAAHTKWRSDEKITLEDLRDLGEIGPVTTARTAAREPRTELADSLDVGPVQHTGVRGVYDTEGEDGVIAMLAADNQLVTFPDIAKEALDFVEVRVRQDPGLRVAVSSLEPEEADGVCRTAAYALLRDAFGSADG